MTGAQVPRRLDAAVIRSAQERAIAGRSGATIPNGVAVGALCAPAHARLPGAPPGVEERQRALKAAGIETATRLVRLFSTTRSTLRRPLARWRRVLAAFGCTQGPCMSYSWNNAMFITGFGHRRDPQLTLRHLRILRWPSRRLMCGGRPSVDLGRWRLASIWPSPRRRTQLHTLTAAVVV